MKNNIGIFSTHPLWPSHFETDLELIQKNINEGDHVIVFNCNSCIKQCELIWNEAISSQISVEEKRVKSCEKCLIKQEAGYSLIKGNIIKMPIISAFEMQKEYNTEDYFYENVTHLKELIVDNQYLVGWSLLSSLVSAYRDPFINIPLRKKELSLLYQDCCRIYFSAREYIKKYNLSRVYVFNGRFSYTKAILDAARFMNIDCYVHERGSDLSKYSLFENHTIHSISKFGENVRLAWDKEKNNSLKESIASQFYNDRKNNVTGLGLSFLDLQDPSLLPENWNKEEHNIIFYTSSEDEFISISPEWNNDLFSTQLEGIKTVSEIVSQNEGYHLYVRMHPNKKGMSEDYLASFNILSEYKNVTVIGYDSNISSYQLLENSHKVITYGSTMTFEALYWGKPSVLLGKNLYYQLKGPYIPSNVDKIEEFILSKNLVVPDNDALKLGYYLKTYGTSFKYYKPIDYLNGEFKGVNLNFIPKTGLPKKKTLFERALNKTGRVLKQFVKNNRSF